MIHAAERAARHPVGVLAVGREGAHVLVRGGGVLTLEVQRLGEAFERGTCLAHGDGGFERAAGCRWIAVPQGRKAPLDRGRGHGGDDGTARSGTSTLHTPVLA